MGGRLPEDWSFVFGPFLEREEVIYREAAALSTSVARWLELHKYLCGHVLVGRAGVAIDRVAGRLADGGSDFPTALGNIERINPVGIGRHKQSDDREQGASTDPEHLISYASGRR